MKDMAKFLSWFMIIIALAGALGWVVYLFDSKPKNGEVVIAAEIKAEQAKQVAVEAETKAVEARPKLEAARAKVIRAGGGGVGAGPHRENIGSKQYRGVAASGANMSAPQSANSFCDQGEQQAAACGSFFLSRINLENLSQLPAPRAAELEALYELVSALEEQLTLEVQRGDAWKAAWEADQGLIEALKKENKAERFVKQIMTFLSAVAVTILVVVLL